MGGWKWPGNEAKTEQNSAHKFTRACLSQDILYRYPSGELSTGEPSAGELWYVDRLVQLRGVFLTLSDVLGSITMATSSW